MGSTCRSFTAEYKAAAVDLVLDGGRTIADVARSIGVHEMTLGKWVKKVREDDRPPGGSPLGEDEHAELERLRAELPKLRMELEFAKKVATWFAKDPR